MGALKNTMTKPVFISYARSTSRSFAEALHTELGGPEGLSFLDTSDIEHGEQFPVALANAILDARVVVIFVDEVYFQRWYCLRELLIVLSAYEALVRRPAATESEKAFALAPVLVAFPPGGLQPRERPNFAQYHGQRQMMHAHCHA